MLAHEDRKIFAVTLPARIASDLSVRCFSHPLAAVASYILTRFALVTEH